MANMSYCKFRNTLSDLRDCMDTLEDEGPLEESEDVSKEEAAACANLIELCTEIANAYGEQ
jgi:hypothetical protein